MRIQYPGALYHVINRGNYRRDVFATSGAARAFENTLAESATRHGWRVHAYAVMPNHFHLALETPRPNLVDGMHWLQSTFATRFNRFRSEQGHLFQGRYQSPVVEDPAALFRVINYVHLNPVEAGIVTANQLGGHHGSSLGRLMQTGTRPSWMAADAILGQLAVDDSRNGWSRYVDYLTALAANSDEKERQQFDELERGWAIGTLGWKRTLARKYAHLALEPGLMADETRELKESCWRDELDAALRHFGKCEADLLPLSASSRWKIEVAARLRQKVAAPYSWIARELRFGNLTTLRSRVRRFEMQRASA
jgi:REP element-mobilizing transposase RayT